MTCFRAYVALEWLPIECGQLSAKLSKGSPRHLWKKGAQSDYPVHVP